MTPLVRDGHGLCQGLHTWAQKTRYKHAAWIQSAEIWALGELQNTAASQGVSMRTCSLRASAASAGSISLPGSASRCLACGAGAAAASVELPLRTRKA